MCSESYLLTEVAFIFPEIIDSIQEFIEKETGSCLQLAKLLLDQMEKRVVYYTESDEMKDLLFFDPRAVQYFNYDWPTIGKNLLSSLTPTPSSSQPGQYKWLNKMRKTDNSTPIKDEIEKYIFECRRGSDMNLNALQYWKSQSASFYSNIKNMALKSLCVPATSVSAERVFSAAGENSLMYYGDSYDLDLKEIIYLLFSGLLDKQRLRNNISAQTMESCLLLRLNHIGERAREISYQPPPVLVPQSDFNDIVSPSNPHIDTTYGYMTDESDDEEIASDDEYEIEL